MRTIAVSLIVTGVLLLASCAGTVPEPTPSHLQWASQRWPGTRMEELRTGRQLYVLKCSGCHSLHRPDELSVQQWEKTVPEMMTRAKLTKEEARLILHYVVTVSELKERAPGEKAPAKESDNHQ